METVPLKTLFKQAKKKNKRRVYPIKKNKSNIGVRHVSKVFCGSCKKRYMYNYTWYEDGRTKSMNSVDIRKLRAKVLNRGLKWEVENMRYLQKVAKNEDIPIMEII